MCKKRTVYTEIIDAVQITSNFVDFDGDADKWRWRYFELLTWKNTWDFPLKMDIFADREHSPFLFLLLKKGNPYLDSENIVSWLEDLGYGNIKVCNEKVMLVEPPYDCDEYVSDYVFDY